MWPDNRILDLFGIEVPIIQAPIGWIRIFRYGRRCFASGRARFTCLCPVERGTGPQ
jgi:hypothetical protein